LDARWTKKNGVSYYGHKNHVKYDAASTLITDYEVTSASVHDSQVLFDLIDESCKGEALFADSAYASEEFAERLEGLEVQNYIHEKGYKNRPLSEVQKEMNKAKSSIRCRVEQIFL
jgi:transposase, IS5 family